MQGSSAVHDALDQANAFAGGALDWLVDAWDGFELRLVGGNAPDAPWGGAAEIVFSDASYVQAPAQMFEAVFRLAIPHEAAALSGVLAPEPGEVVFVIEAGASGALDRRPFLVVARQVLFRVPAAARKAGPPSP